ncbi:membrane integrity-associated transporter subunit PqiC [Roseomonas sp. SSH11]|uniref:Membrane integrity-associated transporter subunit PqiC n=1 Tax=Pararoseomonas baculiformis TaxID=2820812 RepID=A0ABS4AGK4_9PROT|nr:ABC-type transport auxiliary lipoprotein family protein [Pararoseomonas baculiformis]MBP0446135.1 membrane integrity-associated transporter subunit PqiC [Pararoseomonas baculiformis]
MRRRMILAAGLALPGALGACSVVNQSYVESRRYPLSPDRPDSRPRRTGRRTILMRLTRAAPGLDSRLLRSIRPDGTEALEYYAEWTAPPAEAAEEALRRWITESGLFAAVLAPGSRGNADLILESELTALHVDLARGVAVASMSAVLMRETSQFGTRVVAQFSETATAPVPPQRPLGPDAQAAGMVAALAGVLARLERGLARHA